MAAIFAIILIMIFLALLFLLNFYRDPVRNIPHGSKNILAPADGRIINITNTSEKNLEIKKGIFGKINALTKDVASRCYVISIFMSPFDVHVNRAPISGKIRYARHTKGKFFRAYDFEKSLENEKNEILIENKKLKAKVIQIAGFIARRIRCFVKENQHVDKGSKIGSIVLGSQVCLVIPSNAILKASEGMKVKGGETIIAVYD